MTFEDCLNSLFSARGKSSLQNVKDTALKMNLLPLKFKAVHIAGTNGKGTVAGLLAEILNKSCFKTGLFTSPHIKSPLERIKINGANIDETSFIEAVAAVKNNQTSELNFFEVLTLASLYYFTENKVDFAVFECGIGGLLDSTNIIAPELSVITSVALDHCAMLGASIEEIAAQKCGIIKPKIPVLLGPLPKAALRIAQKKASSLKSPLFQVEKPENLSHNFKKLQSSFDFEGRHFVTKLIGVAQNQNAALAVKAAFILGAEAKICQKACAGFALPCRFEVFKLKNGKYFIRDGAHNPAAFKELIKTYKQSPFAGPEDTLVLAASKGHNYEALCALAESNFKNIVLACPDKARNIAPEILLNCFNKNAKTSFLRDISSFNPLELSGNVIAAGSFYLASALNVVAG
ncbi:MAG: Mur ligase family protein [Elusimicrobia bacterium]|nr:Mur ligase family protein [Elusimicrobiota bacterium]